MRFLIWLIPFALGAADISPQSYLADVKFLASPELKGRATGSPELEKAAAFIARQFKSFGLKPPAGKSFEQAFPVTIGAHLGTGNQIRWYPPHGGIVRPSNDIFQPFSFSSSGSVKAQVVFAGYGITSNRTHYDDYAGIDVKDKMVLILRHEPKEGKELSSNAGFAEKAVNAKMHGARGVILVNDVFEHPGSTDEFEKFGAASGPTDAGILFVQMKADAAAQWVSLAGKDLKTIEDSINRDGQPQSFPMDLTVDLSVDVQRETKTVHNVAAYLPGQTSEYVVIGAHYDHLGLGDEHSLAPSQIGQIHPGADDNASGTAGVIELARWFSKQPKHKRGILFLILRGRGVGAAGQRVVCESPHPPAGKRRGDDQYGHDRAHPRRENLLERHRHRVDVRKAARRRESSRLAARGPF